MKFAYFFGKFKNFRFSIYLNFYFALSIPEKITTAYFKKQFESLHMFVFVAYHLICFKSIIFKVLQKFVCKTHLETFLPIQIYEAA